MRQAVDEALIDKTVEASRAGELPPHFYVASPAGSDWARDGAKQGAPCLRAGCSLPASDPIHLRPR